MIMGSFHGKVDTQVLRRGRHCDRHGNDRRHACTRLGGDGAADQNVVKNTGNKVTPGLVNLGVFGGNLLGGLGTVLSNAQIQLGTAGTNALTQTGTAGTDAISQTGTAVNNAVKQVTGTP
jgi:hypothetical protein